MQRSKCPQCILLRSPSDRHIRGQKNKSKCHYQHQIHQQKQSASVLRAQIRKPPDISHPDGTSGCCQHKPQRTAEVFLLCHLLITPIYLDACLFVSRGHRRFLFYLFLLELQVSASNFLLKFLPLPLFFPAAPSLLFTHTCPVTPHPLIYFPLFISTCLPYHLLLKLKRQKQEFSHEMRHIHNGQQSNIPASLPGFRNIRS